MALIDKLNDDMKSALKEGKKEKLNVIRMVKSSIKNEEIKQGKPLNDESILSILMKEVKQRTDANEEFKKGNRNDLVEKNLSEIKILQEYLPIQMTDEEIKDVVEKVVYELTEESNLNIGSIMQRIVPIIKGKADLSKVNAIIKEKLNNL